MRIRKKIISGQSFFEVIFAFGIITLIIVAIAVLASNSIRNNVFSRNNTLANRYAEEAVEWMRRRRDENWNSFKAHAGPVANPAIWCLEDLPLSAWVGGGKDKTCEELNDADPDESDGYIPGTIFMREVELARESIQEQNDAVSAKISVKWNDSQGDHIIEVSTYFTIWNLK